MARLGLALAALAVLFLLLVVLLSLLRVRLWLRLRAGGEPLIELKAGFALSAVRRERRLAFSIDEGRAALARIVGRADGRSPDGPAGGRPDDAGLRPGDGSGGRGGRTRRACPTGLGGYPGRTGRRGRRPEPAAALRRVRPLLGYAVRALSLERITVRVAVGTGDAADTAVLCGLLQAMGGAGLALMSTLDGAPRNASFRVVPSWSGSAVVRLEFICIAKPRLSQAILAAWRVYRAYRRDGPAAGDGADRAVHGRGPPAEFAPPISAGS